MEVRINTKFITLSQFLKMADLIASGGEAKFFLADKTVEVNGVEENRRGRKLYPGDKVMVLGEKYVVRAD